MASVFLTGSRKAILNTKGGIAPIAAAFLITTVLVGALVVDVGFVMMAKSELQNIADAGALAGGRALGTIYRGGKVDSPDTTPNPMSILPMAEQAGPSSMELPGYGLNLTNVKTIREAVTQEAMKHQAGGVQIASASVEYGRWDITTETFEAGTDFDERLTNAVKVTVQRAAGTNGAVTTFFAGLFGKTELDISSNSSIAALLPLSFVPPAQPPNPDNTLPAPPRFAPDPDDNLSEGGLDIPIAVSQDWADNACGLLDSDFRPYPLLLTQTRPAPPMLAPWPPDPPPLSAWEPDPALTPGNSCVVLHNFDSAGGVGISGAVPPVFPFVLAPTNWGETVLDLTAGTLPLHSVTVNDVWTLGGDPVANNAADVNGVLANRGKNSFLANTIPSGTGFMNNRITTTLEGNGITQEWNALVPVYEAADCAPQSGTITIVGFTTVTINAFRNWISIESLCPTVATGKGSATTQNFGTLASIPVLVQ